MAGRLALLLVVLIALPGTFGVSAYLKHQSDTFFGAEVVDANSNVLP